MQDNEKKIQPLEEKEEAFGYVTADYAAELLGLQKSSIKAIAYKHADELKAFRLGGIILVEKAALLSYRDKREVELQEQAAKREARSVTQKKRELQEKLATLSAEQVEALLGQLVS